MVIPYESILTDEYENDAWLSPDGRFYKGAAHEVCAEYILAEVYGMEDVMFAADTLIRVGWVKLTNGFMFSHYVEDGMYANLTSEQTNSMNNWLEVHGLSL